MMNGNIGMLETVAKGLGHLKDEVVSIKLPDGTSIYIFSAPYFIASKLEALKGRGEKDLRLSQDLEDLVAVLDGRKNVAEQLKTASSNLRKYFQSEFVQLFKERDFLREAIEGFLQGSRDYQVRSGNVIKIMEMLAED